MNLPMALNRRLSTISKKQEIKTIQGGPTGGWCSCFRRKDYRKIKW